MLSTRTARWSAVTGLVCVVVLVATWFVLVSPRRSEAADLGDQRASTETQNVSLEAEIADLRSRFGDLEDLRAELARIRKQLPPSADVASLVRSLESIADDSGVTIESITPGAAITVSPATATTPALVSVPVAVTVRGRYVEDALFLRYLQTRLGRVFLVTQVGATRNEEGPPESGGAGATPTATATAAPSPSPTATGSRDDFTLTVSGEIFSLVDAPAASATPAPGAGTPAAPAPAGTAPAPAAATS
jgi:type IV pilus assembly protein PilO